MFDGSHRSRRTIDLSSGGRQRRQRRKTATTTSTTASSTATTTTTTSKSSVLEEARIQRNERRQVQLRHASAKAIQRIYRGRQARKSLAHDLATADISETVVSLRLSVQLARFLTVTVARVLMDYYNHTTTTTKRGSFSFSTRRIFESALSELQPKKSSLLLPLVIYLLPSERLDLECFISLIICCQQWLSSSSDVTDTTVAASLWLWSCRMAAAACDQDKTAVMALLASTMFCARSNSDELLQQGLVEATGLFPSLSDNSLQACQSELLPFLVTALTDTGNGTRVEETIHGAIRGRECIVLQNAIDMWKQGQARQQISPYIILSLLDSVLSKRADLTFLVSLVVRGENVQELLLPKTQHASTTSAVSYSDDRLDMDVDDDEDDDDVEMEEQSALKSEQKRPAKHRSSTLTRPDLQTVPKLDRSYQEMTYKLRKQVLTSMDSSPNKEQFVQLATQLGNPDIWIEWGNIIFDRNSGGQQEGAKVIYVRLLFSLLQCTTGLRTTQSPFLTQLALHRGLRILEGLWQSLVEWMTSDDDRQLLVTGGMAVFCDLFAHHLLVLHDEEFLLYYTASSDTTTRSKRVILAEDVIARLGNALYSVYWTKPVLAADLSDQFGLSASRTVEERLKFHRGRLLLSGTKLWNSLYERWCRLVRHAPSFADESVWWFPSLISREGDGLVSVRDAGVPDDHDDGSTISMDVDDEESDGGDVEPSPADKQSDALSEIFRDPKMARILTCIPQALPFERRVKMFSSLLSVDKQTTQDEETEFRRALMMMARGDEGNDDIDFGGRERVEIRRDVLYEDSMDQLNELGNKLKKKVQVTFINQHGAKEAGIDGGGVFKEFLDDLIKEAFDPGNSNDANHPSTGAPQLFSVTPLQTLSVNASASYDLSHYEFLGRVLGKAVYESILVEPQFCLPFLNQLLGKRNTLDDLKNFDVEYYNNLIKLRNMNANEIDSLGLTFELTTTTTGEHRETKKGTVTRELIPGGSSVHVSKQNVIQYVHLVAHQRLNVDGAAQTKAFLKGFRDLIPASWLRLFSSNELQKLISGDDTVRGIDVRGMKAVMRYSGGYHPSQPIIGWFWEVVEEMTPDQQRKFLRFMTSCSRQPLLGFQALEPLPCIQQLRLGEELFEMHNYDIEALSKVTPLPTSATCMNLLKLPNYMDKQLLKKKLLDAIESGAGFELT